MNCPWCGFPNFEVRCSSCGAREPRRPRLAFLTTLLLAVVLAVANGGTDWIIHFPAHAENVGIENWQRCFVGSKLVWNTVNRIDVEPQWTEVTTHRETRGIPRGALCSAQFDVIRNNSDDPNKDYPAPGESAVIEWTEK